MRQLEECLSFLLCGARFTPENSHAAEDLDWWLTALQCVLEELRQVSLVSLLPRLTRHPHLQLLHVEDVVAVPRHELVEDVLGRRLRLRILARILLE